MTPGARKATRHRTTVILDEEELGAAQRALGTASATETIRRALQEVNRRAALHRGADLIRGGGLGLARPEDLDELRRSRV
ncbi:MAG: hypothetical protein WAM30_11805 [Candidatus Dormiibacterota bacterium]